MFVVLTLDGLISELEIRVLVRNHVSKTLLALFNQLCCDTQVFPFNGVNHKSRNYVKSSITGHNSRKMSSNFTRITFAFLSLRLFASQDGL